MDDALERSIDELYSAPAAEFIPKRKALASALKKQKRPADAARVLGLSKPNGVAAAVNRACAAQPEAFAELVAAGERVVGAFRATLSSGQSAVAALYAAQRTQRDKLAALARRIEEQLRADGSPPSAEAMTRIQSTLLAISMTGRFGDAAWGRLNRELEPPGLELLMEAAAATSAQKPGRPPHAGTVAQQHAEGAAREPAAEPRSGKRAHPPAQEAADAVRASERARLAAERAALQRSIEETAELLRGAARAAATAESARGRAEKDLASQRGRVDRTKQGIEEAAKRLAGLEARLASERRDEQELEAAHRAALAEARERGAEVEALSGKQAALGARLRGHDRTEPIKR